MQMWSWRQAIQKSNLQSTTRLVLHNLSTHMNDAGESCFPSINTQATDTGLSERCVCTHLGLAEGSGFIQRTKHGYAGQKWSRNEYRATYPKGTEPNDNYDPKALNLTTEGTEPNDIKALNDVPTNYPLELSKELSSKNYNKKIPKKVTLLAWEQENGQLSLANIIPWLDDNSLSHKKVKPYIEDFRLHMEANGNTYANFESAFKTWLKKGYLNVDMRNLKETSKELDLDNNNPYGRGI